MDLSQLLAKVEQEIKGRGFAVIWSTDKLAYLFFVATGIPYLEDGTNAVTDSLTREVVIRTDLDEWQTVRSLTHELGHVILNASVDDRQNDRSEWEAECFASAVLDLYGLDRPEIHEAYLTGFYSWLMGDSDKNMAIAKAKEAAEAFVAA